MTALARRVLDGLSACGLRPDAQGAVASSPLFARSIAAWQQRRPVVGARIPIATRGLMLLSVVVESDSGLGRDAAPERWRRRSPARRTASSCSAGSPPRRWPSARRPASCATSCCTERRAQGRARHQARRPAADRGARPLERPRRRRDRRVDAARLEAAEAAGTLAAADAAILRDAFELVCALRMEHQVEQLRAGHAAGRPDRPAALTPLTRTALKEAFRAVARVQRGIAVRQG